MFINKKRIDDDLQIAQRAFMGMPLHEKESAKPASRIDDSGEPFTFSEFISLCGAAFAVILPWALAFAGALALVGWLLVMWVR